MGLTQHSAFLTRTGVGSSTPLQTCGATHGNPAAVSNMASNKPHISPTPCQSGGGQRVGRRDAKAAEGCRNFPVFKLLVLLCTSTIWTQALTVVIGTLNFAYTGPQVRGGGGRGGWGGGKVRGGTGGYRGEGTGGGGGMGGATSCRRSNFVCGPAALTPGG